MSNKCKKCNGDNENNKMTPEEIRVELLKLRIRREKMSKKIEDFKFVGSGRNIN